MVHGVVLNLTSPQDLLVAIVLCPRLHLDLWDTGFEGKQNVVHGVGLEPPLTWRPLCSVWPTKLVNIKGHRRATGVMASPGLVYCVH